MNFENEQAHGGWAKHCYSAQHVGLDEEVTPWLAGWLADLSIGWTAGRQGRAGLGWVLGR